MPKKKRRLWLEVKFKAPGVSRDVVLQTLKDSIDRGDYKIPKNWQVIIAWRNKENAPMKFGEWKAELKKSRKSSSGFDTAVLDFLDRK